MSPRERFIGSRVVSRKVLGSANPLAKGFRDTKQGCMDSIGGMFLGFILFALAFVPAWCSVRGVAEHSKTLDALPLLTAAEAKGQTGLLKVHGKPENVEVMPFDIACKEINAKEDVFWYHTALKEFREHPETRQKTVTRTVNGQEVQETVEEQYMVQDWQVLDEQTQAASSFMLGEIEVLPRESDLRLTRFESCQDKGPETLGSRWLLVEYLPIEDVGDLVVVGEMVSDRISSGTPFIITDKSADELVADLAASESAAKWGLTALSVILFFLGFNLIIGPLLFLLKYVPFVGGGLRFVIGVISLVLSIVLVLIIKFVILYWWVILVLLAGVVILVAVLAGRRHPKAVEEKAAPEMPSIGEAKPNFCPKCGDQVDPEEKFCNKCGTKLV